MKDITNYSVQELSLLVFNTESLYNIRFMVDLRSTLEELYIFTEEQWDELESDIDSDLGELTEE